MPTSLMPTDGSLVTLRNGQGPDTLALAPFVHAEPGLPTIPGYDVLEELGRGGMGVVYKARDQKLKRLVAIKMLLDPEFASAEQRMRFKIEAEAVAQLKHPNIVQVYELGEMPGSKSGIPHPYMVLEYVEGPTLFRYRRQHQFTERETATLMVTLARAMQHAHDHGLIHRDLKPANILLSPESLVLSPESADSPFKTQHSGLSTQHFSTSSTQDSALRTMLNPKITDFGLVKAITFDGEGQRDLTRPEFMVGTPQYMAPEQANPAPHPLSCSVDVYSLGVILYELLTGQLPYDDKDILKMLMEVQTSEPVSPRRLQPRLSADLETICLKCLEKEPYRRYHSAAALADDLSRYLHHEPIHARPLSEWQRITKWVQRHPTVASLASLLFAVITTGLVVIATLWRQADADRRQAVGQSINAERARDEARGAEKQAREAEQAALKSDQQSQRALYFSKVAQADLLLRQGNMLRANMILRDVASEHEDTDLRNWEWRYLAKACSSMEQTLTAASDYVHKVAFHPNGRWLINIQGAVFFGGKPPETFPGELHFYIRDDAEGRWRHKRSRQWKWPLRDLLFAAKGAKTIITNMHNEADCFDTEQLVNGDKILRGARIPQGYRWELAADAAQLVMWTDGKPTSEVKLFDLHQMAFVQSITLPSDIEKVSVDDLGQLIVFRLKDNTIGVWDLKLNALCWKRQLSPGEISFCVTADGRQMAYHQYPHGELAWLVTRTAKTLLSIKKVPGDHVWMPPQGDRLAVSTPGPDGIESMIWRRQPTGEIDEIPIRLAGHVGGVTLRKFNHDGNLLVTTGFDGSARLWDTSLGDLAGNCKHTYRGHAGTVLAADFHPGNDLIATGGIDANVVLWNNSRHIVRDHCNLHDGFSGEWISGYRFIEGTNVLAYLDQQHGRLLHMDLDSRKIVNRFTLPNMCREFQVPRDDSDFTPDGKMVAVLDKSNQKAMLFDVQTGNPVWSPPHSGYRIITARFSGNGKRLLLAGMPLLAQSKPVKPVPYRSRYQVWDVPTQKLVIEGDLPRTSTSWAINYEGTRVAATQVAPGRKYELNVYKADEQGQQLYSVPFQFPWCFSLTYSKDGRYLAGVNFDSVQFKMMMRDAHTGKELWLRDTVPETVDVAFSPDSERVFTTSYDSNVMIHDVKSGQDVLMLKHHGTPRSNDYALSPKVVFSTDGRKLVVHDWACGLTIWHAYGKDDKVELTIPLKRAYSLESP